MQKYGTINNKLFQKVSFLLRSVRLHFSEQKYLYVLLWTEIYLPVTSLNLDELNKNLTPEEMFDSCCTR